MLDGIDQVLDGVVSRVQLDMFEEAIQAMELFKFYDTVSQLSLYVSGCGQHEPILIQQMVYEIVNRGLDDLLNGFEILTIEAPMECKINIIKGLYYMENTDQSEIVTGNIENAESVKDAFINLLEFFTGKGADYYFPYISGDDNSYVAKLYEIHKVRVNLQVEDIKPVDESAVSRCRKFMEVYPQSLLHEAIQVERFTPGVSSQILFDFYQSRLNQLYPHALKQLAVEIVGLMCLTNALNRNFNAEVKKKLSAIIPDQMEAAKMVVDIDDITMRLDIYAS